MEFVGLYITIVILTYLFASIPWGLLLGKAHGIDIRKEGSGNIGATNVNRVLGKKWGVLCFFLDFLKGCVPVTIVILLMKYGIISKHASFAVVLASFTAVAGHNWSIFLKFKGGKGISTTAGALVMFAWPSLLIAFISWVIIVKLSRYVSLASITAALLLPISAFILNTTHIYSYPLPELGLLVVLGVIAVVKHRSNIQRLLNGTENRFKSKKEKLEEQKIENKSTEESV